MIAFQNSRRFILSLFMLAGVVLASGCETNTNDPLPTGKTLTVGGKVNSASKDGNFITFSPSSEFFSARFYEGSVPFNDLSGSKWQDRGIIDRLADNTTMNDNINDHKSPFNVSTVSALESGKTYTMLIFYTSATTDVNNQGTIVFTR